MTWVYNPGRRLNEARTKDRIRVIAETSSVGTEVGFFFTEEEFDHLRGCSECVDAVAEAIREAIRSRKAKEDDHRSGPA